ncbi:MAG: 4-hydroxy-tetrahydrodipicolinate reductase [bacterium]
MVNVIITGACGRMGSRITDLARNENRISVKGLVDRSDCDCFGKELFPGLIVTSDLVKVIDQCDIVIDFTSPKSSLQYLEAASKHKKGIVIGTTGFDDKQIKEINNYSNSVPVVFAPNMSVGVNVLFKIIQEAAGLLNGYDVEIIEAHHNKKKDAPSGTAKRIAEIVSKELGYSLGDSVVYGRSGNVGERKKKEIGIHSIRAGNIIGDHTICFASSTESIELKHRAFSRDALAEGAIRAAIWLKGKGPGLYSMNDILGLK